MGIFIPIDPITDKIESIELDVYTQNRPAIRMEFAIIPANLIGAIGSGISLCYIQNGTAFTKMHGLGSCNWRQLFLQGICHKEHEH